MTDPDATWAVVIAPDTTPRERSLASLELLAWIGAEGWLIMQYEDDGRNTLDLWVAGCTAVIRAELDSYQTLLLRMENR